MCLVLLPAPLDLVFIILLSERIVTNVTQPDQETKGIPIHLEARKVNCLCTRRKGMYRD